MRLVFQLRHMSPTKPGNNCPYHLLDMGTRLVLLPVLLLVPFHLRCLGKGIRLFLMLELSRSLYLQKELDMHRYVQLLLKDTTTKRALVLV